MRQLKAVLSHEESQKRKRVTMEVRASPAWLRCCARQVAERVASPQEGEILPPSPAVAPHPSTGGGAAPGGGSGREYDRGAPGGGGREYDRDRGGGGGGGGGEDRPRDYSKDRPRDYGGRGPPPWGQGGPQYGHGYHYQQHPPHMRQSMGPPGGYGGGRGHLMPPVRALQLRAAARACMLAV
jgi:hypothetical protein